MPFRSKLAIGGFCVALVGLLVEPSLSETNYHQSAPVRSILPSGRGDWHLYDRNRDHIWNRLYRSLYLRTHDDQEYGYDELDAILWPETTYLLSGPAYQHAVNSLDEFLASRAERLISDPLKRALLQRDLWAVFDWTTARSDNRSPERRNLQVKLAQVIRRLALSAEQIRALPDNYRDAVATKTFGTHYDSARREAAFLPADLFQPNGPWVAFSAEGGRPAALSHVHGFSGRSVFLAFIRLPEGRDATLLYLTRLIPDPGQVIPNSQQPHLPVGTHFALVRQMVLIDQDANLTPTRLTEDIQIRVHRTAPADIPDFDRNNPLTRPDGYEFKLSRAKLFARDAGGLRSVGRNEREFALFMSHGIDPFETRRVQRPFSRGRHIFDSCSGCHYRPGGIQVAGKVIASWDQNYEAAVTKSWKHEQYNWGLLQGLWQLQPSTSSR